MQVDINPTHSAAQLRIGLVVSQYHSEVTNSLRDGALEAFKSAGGKEENLFEISAPGTFELPAISAALARRRIIDAVVALGCVISGETTHDQYISTSVSNALANLATETEKPIGFGVLTCQSINQAKARAGGDKGNKGNDTMAAVIEAVHSVRVAKNIEVRQS